MKRTLKILLIIATLIGIAIPAMANPENEPIGVAKNLDSILVNLGGNNAVNNNVVQSLANLGSQTNWAQGTASTGNAVANSANVGYADSGASSIAANNNDAMGNSNAVSGCAKPVCDPCAGIVTEQVDMLGCGNNAVNTQDSSATSNSGEATGFDSEVDQSNDVTQTATAPIENTQTLTMPVVITDIQGATTTADGFQTINDSMIVEHNWTKSVTKNIN